MTQNPTTNTPRKRKKKQSEERLSGICRNVSKVGWELARVKRMLPLSPAAQVGHTLLGAPAASLPYYTGRGCPKDFPALNGHLGLAFSLIAGKFSMMAKLRGKSQFLAMMYSLLWARTQTSGLHVYIQLPVVLKDHQGPHSPPCIWLSYPPSPHLTLV